MSGEAPVFGQEPAPLRMMTRREFGGGDSVTVRAQETLCLAGTCDRGDTHHPRCPRLEVSSAEPGAVQIRCGCAVNEHCRNHGLPCGGSPCYIVIDELSLLELSHQVARTRFIVTRQEESRARREAARGSDDDGG